MISVIAARIRHELIFIRDLARCQATWSDRDAAIVTPDCRLRGRQCRVSNARLWRIGRGRALFMDA